MPAGLVSPKANLSWPAGSLLLCPCLVVPLCICTSDVSLCTQISSSNDISHSRSGLTLRASLSLTHMFKDAISKHSHLLRYWASLYEFEGNRIQPITPTKYWGFVCLFVLLLFYVCFWERVHVSGGERGRGGERQDLQQAPTLSMEPKAGARTHHPWLVTWAKSRVGNSTDWATQALPKYKF